MKYVFTALMAVGALVFLAAPATADWGVGDPAKMHFPQLPDPFGWDVKFGPFVDQQGLPGIKVLADDWLCTETGPVRDIHFWFSAKHGQWEPGVPIQNIHASIWSNDPGVPGQVPSRPKELLWWGDSANNDFRYTINPNPGTGDQAWYDPNLPTDPPGNPIPNDHNLFWQVNIDIPATAARPPFEQQKGQVYWLDLFMVAGPPVTAPIELGWKTADTRRYPEPYTGKHFLDDAVWGHLAPDATGRPEVHWMGPLEDLTGPVPRSLDLAFVITPEPGTVAMLIGAGLIGLAAYACRRRK